MPVIIAVAIRYVIMAAVQLGIWWALENFGIPLLNKAVEAIMQQFGVSEETAKDIMANKIVVAFESVGIFAVTLRTKLPIKVAEYLGFTSKGYGLRKITTVAGVKAEAEVAKIVVQKTGGAVISAAEAVTAVEAAKISKLGFKPAYDIILKLVGVTFMGFMVVGNWIDFGNWNNGAYQKSMQKFISWITFGALVPDVDYRKSLTVSDAIFTKIFNTFKLGGAVGIQDPFKGVEVPFTRDNLLDLTDKVGSTLLLTDGTASAKKVLGAVLPMIIFIEGADIDKVLADAEATPAKTNTTVSVAPITKVFTGIVSQGVVGEGLVFTARPDDMIESAEELRSAAANNLAPFLNTLLGKIVYEVKVVSSVISKDGFKQTGTTQRIQTGTYKNGTPKYKSVTNKFATLVVYALTDKGSRAKLTTIVLGPTDSAKLTIGQNDLQALQNALPALVTTTDIKDITGISTTAPVAVSNPQQATPTPVSTPASAPVASGSYYITFTFNGVTYQRGGFETYDLARGQTSDIYAKYNPAVSIVIPWKVQQGNPNIQQDPKWGVASAPATVPVVTPASSSSAKAGANASTLYEWYQAQGQALPSVAARAQIYAGFGLGQASYYTGTSEQNTKLLAALKGSPNASTSSAANNTTHIVDNMYLQA